MGAALARSLRRVVEGARTMRRRRARPAWRTPRLAPGELLELQRALGELHRRHEDGTARLRGEIERLEVTLDSITEGILVTDTEGRILMANRALRDLYGLSQPMAGRRVVEAVRNATVGEAIEDALAGRGPTSCEIAEGTGPPRHLDVHTAPIPGPEGVSGTVTVFYEITRLRRLERMREDFVANVSHELRTPLTAIKGCAETLADGALRDPAAARRFVDVIGNHADRLTTLLNDLLDLARLESERTTLEPSETRVARLVETARDAVSKVAADKGIRLEAAVPDGLAVRCDRRLIEQALINLVDNAVKYTAEGGAVRVSARVLPRRQARADLDGRSWSTPSEGAAGARGERRRRGRRGGGHGDRHPLQRGGAGLRAVLPGRQGALPGPGGHRPRPGDRAPRRRAPRRAGLRRHRARPRFDLRVQPDRRLTA